METLGHLQYKQEVFTEVAFLKATSIGRSARTDLSQDCLKVLEDCTSSYRGGWVFGTYLGKGIPIREEYPDKLILLSGTYHGSKVPN